MPPDNEGITVYCIRHIPAQIGQFIIRRQTAHNVYYWFDGLGWQPSGKGPRILNGTFYETETEAETVAQQLREALGEIGE